MLFLVSTPIGNLEDISLRALKVLQQVDVIAAEDTRTTKQLFTLLGIKGKSFVAYHEHSTETAREKLLEKLRSGLDVALVCDAGTPLISDPGYKLVRQVREQGTAVTTVPGANAVLSALQLSGLPSDSFYFGGFLPSKTGVRKKTLAAVGTISATLIFYDTPNRLEASLQDILTELGNRTVAVVREITKKFEQVVCKKCTDLLEYYRENGAPKGELVLVIDRAEEKTETEGGDIKKELKVLLKKHTVKEAVQLMAAEKKLSKKSVYQYALQVVNEE